MASARPLIPHPTNNAQPTISPESWARSRMTSQEIIGNSTCVLPRDLGDKQAPPRIRRELKVNFVGSASSESQLLLPCYHFGVSRCNHKHRTGWDLNPRIYSLFRFDLLCLAGSLYIIALN